jgi:catechol 2,3-dioxygenase-like lactoylglutathione lyase family enzyme
MDARVDLITLRVEDLEAATRYFVDGLGWRLVLAVPDDVTFVQLGPGQVLALFIAARFDEQFGPTVHPQFNLARVVASEAMVHAEVERMVEAGGRLLREPERAPWGGYTGVVVDGAGCCWEIAHNPGWSVAEDGTVSIGSVD